MKKCSAKNLLDDQEVKQHQQAKDDAIPSEDLEVVFLIYCIKNLITMIDETNAVIKPTIKIKSSADEKTKPNFNGLNNEAPNMTGIARKNVNSAATVLEMPRIKAPTIVAPERDVPGKTAGNQLKKPIKITV